MSSYTRASQNLKENMMNNGEREITNDAFANSDKYQTHRR